jgi:nitroreductase
LLDVDHRLPLKLDEKAGHGRPCPTCILRSSAERLDLKDVGVLIQTLYMMATDMGLGGCAIGSANIDLFANMTGIEFHVEGPVVQFAIGRGSKSGAPTDALD